VMIQDFLRLFDERSIRRQRAKRLTDTLGFDLGKFGDEPVNLAFQVHSDPPLLVHPVARGD